MHRRDFFKTCVQAAAASAAGTGIATGTRSGPASPGPIGFGGTPLIVKGYDGAEHRRRLENIGECTRAIRSCMRRHLITGYLPGQCCYNLCEYPGRKPYDPDDYDEAELDRLKAHGIGLIQVFEEWSDPLRLFGGNRYAPSNPAGFRRFVDMIHRRGMKLIVYVSSGYFEEDNPDFRAEWSRQPMRSGPWFGWWTIGRCSPASPGWRAYLLPRVARILDEFGVDGIYDDWGYLPNARPLRRTTFKDAARDDVAAFEETDDHDGAKSDLLAIIYAEVKRRGGIFKLHADGAQAPQTRGLKVYDYLWVGEGVKDADRLREATRNHAPYLVPCIDMAAADVVDDEPFLQAIPYMQFPLLHGGRPCTGERALIPGVRYGGEDSWRKRCRAIWEHHRAHPDGPHTYTWWDFFPGRAETRPLHARWLERYSPLVEEGTWAWLEIGESTLFTRPLPPGVVASAFANRDIHLVLANYGRAPVEIATSAPHVALDNDASSGTTWTLAPRSLTILRRAVA